MSAIIVERPGGKKPPFFSKQNRLLGFWLVFIWISISFGLVTIGHLLLGIERNSLLVNLSGVVILLAPLYLYFWRQLRSDAKEYSEAFNSFGEDVAHCGPTKLGWVVVGENWIGSATYPKTTQKLDGSDIDNIFWGDPGSFSQSSLNADFPLDLDLRSFGSSPNFYWLIVYSQREPVKSLVLTFRKKSERDEWLVVAKALASKSEPEVASPKPVPTKWQLACKGRFGLIAYLLAGITGLFVGLVVFATIRNEKPDAFTYAFMAILLLPSLSFSWAVGPSVSRFTMRMWLLICGGDPGTLYASRPGLAGGMLFLEQGNPGHEYVERIPVSEISRVKLEDWGHSFAERDLNKIFDKSVQPKNLVIRLYLDRTEDNEREIRLGREDAIAWHKTLNDLVPSK